MEQTSVLEFKRSTYPKDAIVSKRGVIFCSWKREHKATVHHLKTKSFKYLCKFRVRDLFSSTKFRVLLLSWERYDLPQSSPSTRTYFHTDNRCLFTFFMRFQRTSFSHFLGTFYPPQSGPSSPSSLKVRLFCRTQWTFDLHCTLDISLLL